MWRMDISCWLPKATNVLFENIIRTYFSLFHSNSGYVNAPQCCVIRIWPVLFLQWHVNPWSAFACCLCYLTMPLAGKHLVIWPYVDGDSDMCWSSSSPITRIITQTTARVEEEIASCNLASFFCVSESYLLCELSEVGSIVHGSWMESFLCWVGSKLILKPINFFS